MIAKGTRLKVLLEGSTSKHLPLTEANLHAGVMDILTKKFAAVSVSIMPRTSVYVGIIDWPYRAEAFVTTTVAYASPDDPASIVANAFYQIGGALPGACVDGYGRCAVEMKPSVDDDSQNPSSFGKWAAFAIVALVAVTATGVFVAKRG